MKLISAFILLTFVFSMVYLSNTHADDYNQWKLPEGAKYRLGKGSLSMNTYNGVRNPYWFSPDSETLTVVSSIGIWLYDVHTGKELKLLPIPVGFTNHIIGSPNGKLIVSINKFKRGITQFWDVNTEKPHPSYTQPNSGISTFAFNHDGSEFVTGSLDNTIRLWNTETGEHKSINTGGKSWDKVLYSPDRRTIASEDNNGISLWDLKTGILRKSIKKGDRIIISFAFSPDGSVLAVREYRKIEIWDTTTGDLKGSFRNTTGPHSPIPFSPDSLFIATANHKKIHLWEVQSGELRTTLSGHKRFIGSVTFSPDSKIVASSDSDGIRFWNSNSGEQEAILKEEKSHHRLTFCPKGLNLISEGKSNLYLWKIDKKNYQNSKLTHKITGHNPSVNSVAFNIDGQTLASAHHSEEIRLWDVDNGQLRTLCKGNRYPLWIQSVMFSPDGTTLASMNTNTQSSGGHGQIILWDANSGNYRNTQKGHGGMIGKWVSYHPHSIAFTTDGETLVSGSLDGTVRYWNTKTKQKDTFFHNIRGMLFGHQKAVLKGHTDQVLSVALSYDDSIIASGSLDKTIRLWHPRTHQLKAVLKENNDGIKCVVFRPDRETLASLDEDGQIYLWNYITTELITNLTQNLKVNENIVSLAFSPDGNILASGGDNIHLWDMNTNTLNHTLAGYKGGVKSLTFSPNGSLLASGTSFGTILIWELPQ